LSKIFADPIQAGRALVIDMGVLVYSAGEFSHDLRFIYVPVAEGADIQKLLKTIKKMQCASDEVVRLRQIHDFSVDGPSCAWDIKP
ncbi:MAG TPA: hypothetical protein PKI93_05265, partial [Alphaproteobacteria bacterium]|nr:hypothetical protein [Alphaproteobacteria bacterium]